MTTWLRKNVSSLARAQEFADRKSACGCLTVIVATLHGFQVCWKP